MQRRELFLGLAGLLVSPAIVHAKSLMPISARIDPRAVLVYEEKKIIRLVLQRVNRPKSEWKVFHMEIDMTPEETKRYIEAARNAFPPQNMEEFVATLPAMWTVESPSNSMA